MAEKLDDKRILFFQKVAEGVLYCTIVVDITVLALMSSITSEQSAATEKTEAKVKQLHDYIATNPAAVI